MVIGKLPTGEQPKKRGIITDTLKLQALERLQARNAKGSGFYPNTNTQVAETLTLSLESQKRTELLKKYPQLEGKVQVTNEKIIVTTEAGKLTFGFSHTEGGQTFKNAQKPYSKEQFEALVKVFGNKPAPYLDILGMKNTHTDNGKHYDWNFYWSSSRNDFSHAWGLDLLENVVGVHFSRQDYRLSAVSVQN